MLYIYILQLESNKFYIGKTNNPKNRLLQHFDLNASAWTTKYKPIKVIEIIDDCDDYDEDKYVLKYMNKYGIENVRGGSYSSIILSNVNKTQIIRQLRTINNQCYQCGSIEHFIKDCNKKKVKYKNIDMCFRCGRRFHLAEKCNAYNHIYGKTMHACYRCGREGHWRIACNEQTDIYGRKTKDMCIIS